MATMATATVQRTKLRFFVLITLALSGSTNAAEFRLAPALKLESTYTDNVELSQDDKTSSFVNQFGVTLDQNYKSKVLEFEVDLYSRYALYSHDDSLNKDYHDLSADIKYALWPNGINFIGQASLSNESRNSARNAIADIITSDTVQVQRYTGGLQYSLDNSDIYLDSAIGYRQTISEDNIGEQQGYFGNVDSQNSTQARFVFWDLNASYQYLENQNQDGTTQKVELKVGAITPYKITPFVRFYDEQNTGNINTGNRDLGSNSYGIGARWLITPRLFIDLSYNKPKDGQTDLDGKELKEYIDSRLSWEPSVRTQLDASFSQRFYGNSYFLSFEHRNRRLTNSISYDEKVQAFTRGRYEPRLQGFYWCPVGDIEIAAECFLQSNTPIDFDNFNLVALNNFELVEDNEFSLNKSLRWTSVLALPRTTFSLTLEGNRRTSLATEVDDETIAASLSVKRKISGNSDLNLIATYNDDIYSIKTDNERKSKYLRYSAEYIKQLNRKLDATFGISHLDRESTLITDNYKEGRVYFQIKKGF